MLTRMMLLLIAAVATALLIGSTASAKTGVHAGSQGNDRQSGGAGRDVVDGADGNDRQSGGKGIDALRGGKGKDVQDGGAGADALIGSAGADTQRGGPGNDYLAPGGGKDSADGGGGADVMVVAGDEGGSPAHGQDRVVCGPGRDVVWASSRDEVGGDCELVYRGEPRLPLPKPEKRAARIAAIVNGCDLVPHTRCPGVDLRLAALTGLDLTGAIFTDGNLYGAGMARTILTGADISGKSLMTSAVAIQANLIGANLSGAWSPFVKYIDAKLNNLTGIGVNFSFAELTKADLSGANLIGADLEYSTLFSTNLKGADLTGALTKGAKFCNTTMPDGSINNAGC
jgi:hypothetical protein